MSASFESDTFKRFVEVGRVVYLRDGPYVGKIAAIVEIIDHNRALVEGPEVPRQSVTYRRSLLTPLVLSKLTRGARSATLLKIWKEADIDSKWKETTWAKKREALLKKKSLNDFERFKVRQLKKQRRQALGSALKKSLKA